jgi:hypothetical protein
MNADNTDEEKKRDEDMYGADGKRMRNGTLEIRVFTNCNYRE